MASTEHPRAWRIAQAQRVHQLPGLLLDRGVQHAMRGFGARHDVS